MSDQLREASNKMWLLTPNLSSQLQLTQFYLHACDMMTNGTIGVETRNAILNIEMALMRKYF